MPELDAVTAAFVVDCKEAAVNNTITYSKMIEVFWTGGLANDLRDSLEEQDCLDRMAVQHFDRPTSHGLAATLRQFGGLTVIDDLKE